MLLFEMFDGCETTPPRFTCWAITASRSTHPSITCWLSLLPSAMTMAGVLPANRACSSSP
jgi:hypothetical protein